MIETATRVTEVGGEKNGKDPIMSCRGEFFSSKDPGQSHLCD